MQFQFVSKTKISRENTLLPAGWHTAKLTKVRQGRARVYEDGPRPCLIFTFTTADGHTVNRTVGATVNPRGKLLELLTQLTGSRPAQEVLEDAVLLTELLLKLEGKDYRIHVQPSENGRFNDLVGAAPINSEQRA